MLTNMLTYSGLSVRPTEENDMAEDGVARIARNRHPVRPDAHAATRTERRDIAISAWRVTKYVRRSPLSRRISRRYK